MIFENTRTGPIGVGVLWLGLTVPFEFLFGNFIAGDTWSALQQYYDLLAGYVWVLVSLTMLGAPLLFGDYLRRYRSKSPRAGTSLIRIPTWTLRSSRSRS